MLCKKCRMINCFQIHVPSKPLHAQCTECGHEQKVKFDEIPDYADIYTIESFIKHCEMGGFIDYDGYGNLGTKDKMSGLEIRPSMLLYDIIYTDERITSLYTHIIWFNR